MDKLLPIVMLLAFSMYFIPSDYIRPMGKIIAFIGIIGAIFFFCSGKKKEDKDDENEEE